MSDGYVLVTLPKNDHLLKLLQLILGNSNATSTGFRLFCRGNLANKLTSCEWRDVVPGS